MATVALTREVAGCHRESRCGKHLGRARGEEAVARPRPHPLPEDEMISWGERAMAQSGETGSARAMEIWLLPFAAMFM